MTNQEEKARWEAVTGRILSVETLGTLDGPGLRYVLFLQGCPLACQYCHNPDAIGFDGGVRTTAGEAVSDMLRYRSFIASGGITLTGGEPLAQPRFAEAILRLAAAEGLHTVIDNSGGMPLEACRDEVDAADLLLLDLKAMDAVLCKRVSGRGNEDAKAMLEHREAKGAPVWIRHVGVPGLTLDYGELDDMAAYVARFHCVELVELLPFHKMGEFKWVGLSRPYELADTPEPDRASMEKARAIFRSHGLKVR